VAVGLLLLRCLVGLVLAAHGAQKLFGWFRGHGIGGTADFLESLGWRPGRTFAVLLGGAELVGGVTLLLGVGTPLAAGAVIAVLANAAWVVHRPNGLWNANGGYEYPLVLAGAALALACTGAGRFSLDHLLGSTIEGAVGGLIALAMGVGGWLVGTSLRDVQVWGVLDRLGGPVRHGT
jgi:putative oxidoreductase